MTPRMVRLLLVSSTALSVCAIDLALAQEPEPNVTVETRPRPEYDPLGIRAGAFLIRPQVEVLGSYSDNVALEEDDEQSDFVAQVQPEVTAQSQWSRHALAITAAADIARHLEEDSEDFEDVSLSGEGRLDVTRQAAATAEALIERGHEGRDDPEDIGDGDIVPTLRYGGALGFTQEFNRVNVGIRGQAFRTTFDDAAQEDLDGNVYDLFLRGGYLLSPRINTFVELRYNVDDRDDQFDDNGIERGSHGYEARLGTAVDLTALLFGEAFVGYRVQQFEDDAFDDATGVSFGANLAWNITQLTTITLEGTRDFEPTAQGGASSNQVTTVGVTVDHELLRNVLLNGNAQYSNDEFQDDDRTDDTIIAGGGITYLLNRNLSLEGQYRFANRDSTEAGEDFTENRFTVGFVARL